MDYKVGFCYFCGGVMSLKEIQTGVTWEAEEDGIWWHGYWFGGESETVRNSHKRCWKALQEGERKQIRKNSEVKPACMGEVA